MENETEEEQLQRWDRLRAYGMANRQTPDERQKEIDRFQTGKTEFCLFTLAAGGTGISLDQYLDSLRPRTGYFTPTYNGPEVKQALGRTIRRATKSDVYQYICCMLNSIEQTHVAPILDIKLKCIAEMSGMFVLVDLQKHISNYQFRTIEQATIEADDDTTQLREWKDETEDEDDEDDQS